MSEIKQNTNLDAIASEEAAVQGTVESNNPNNVVAVETPPSRDANGTVGVASVSQEPVSTEVNGVNGQNSNVINPQVEQLPPSSEDSAVATSVLQKSGYLDKDGHITEKLARMISGMASHAAGGLNARIRVQFYLSQLVKAGFKLCYIGENREVSASQIDKLYDDVKNSKDKCFSEIAKVVSARRVLEEGLCVKDIDGKEITLESEDLDRCLVLIDGQHRNVVCIEHPEIDMLVEIDDYEGSTIKRIAVFNNKRKDHTGKDQKQSISKHFTGEVPLLDEIAEMSKTFGVTEKYAEAAETGKVDQFKRDELTKIQMGEKEPDAKYKGDPEKIAQGWEWMYALKLAFSQDNDTWKKVRKVELPLACHRVIEGLQDEDQPQAPHRLAILLAKMDPTQRGTLAAKIGTDELQSYLNKVFTKFLKDHDKAKDWADLEEEFSTSIEKLKRDMGAASSSTTVKKLSSGTPWDIIANRRNLARQQQEKEAKKSAKSSPQEATPSTESKPSETAA